MRGLPSVEQARAQEVIERVDLFHLFDRLFHVVRESYELNRRVGDDDETAEEGRVGVVDRRGRVALTDGHHAAQEVARAGRAAGVGRRDDVDVGAGERRGQHPAAGACAE